MADLYRGCVKGLGIAPSEFWAMHPAECFELLKVEEHKPDVPDPEAIEELMRKYPDASRKAAEKRNSANG